MKLLKALTLIGLLFVGSAAIATEVGQLDNGCPGDGSCPTCINGSTAPAETTVTPRQEETTVPVATEINGG
ncbi:MAG: hypothetical protein K9K67_03065 [Bacteriovoracaceae bacterium]|nr:hypothetical protein [Bacteriovoracaceae bacterium]